MPIPKLCVELSTVYKLRSAARQAQITWSQKGERETDIEAIRHERMVKKDGVLSTREKNKSRCPLSLRKWVKSLHKVRSKYINTS